jgi:hypothetical protein
LTDRDSDLSELARRFLAGHGPANERDLAKWAGIALNDARRGLRAAGADVEERPGGLVDLAGREVPQGRPLPRLLGGFDPLLFGWLDRTPVLGGNQTIVTRNGIFRPFALVDGQAGRHLGYAAWQGGARAVQPHRGPDPGSAGQRGR